MRIYVLCDEGQYCCVPVTHKVTLGEIVDLLEQFKQQPKTLLMPKMPDGSFAKKLFSLYNYLSSEGEVRISFENERG